MLEEGFVVNDEVDEMELISMKGNRILIITCYWYLQLMNVTYAVGIVYKSIET